MHLRLLNLDVVDGLAAERDTMGNFRSLFRQDALSLAPCPVKLLMCGGPSPPLSASAEELMGRHLRRNRIRAGPKF